MRLHWWFSKGSSCFSFTSWLLWLFLRLSVGDWVPVASYALLATSGLLVVWTALLTPFFVPALRRPMLRTVGFLGGITPRAVQDRVQKVSEAILVFQNLPTRNVVMIWLVSLFSYVLFVLSAYVLMRGMSINLGIYAVAWMRPLVFVMTMIPITVGGLGVREASYVEFMGFYGVESSSALAFGLLLFSIQVAMGLVGGMLDVKEGSGRIKEAKASKPTSPR